MVLKTYMERISNRIPHLDMITLIKCGAIIYICVIDIFIGIFITTLVDKYIFPKKFSENDKDKSTVRLMFEIALIISIIYVLAYFIRNIIQIIPFPFDNQYGFDYSRINEVNSGALISGTLILYCNTLYSKVVLLRKKLGAI